ncbi:unnamed protein product [Arctia plantaginis]|uniref:Regulatory protein zeste n=1 Tax=Arctia plantaginis TaxID=874455 RepID=A0A8S1BPT8_ARCPL|nr:unnamed protein product [Arctia plantaginis]
MAEKRKRSQNFTSEEKDKLVKLLMDHKNTILNKKTDGCTNEAKILAWNQLTASFNATGTVYRTKESLIKVWEKMKSESKVYYNSSRRSAVQTGGGPSLVKTDPILEQVCSILGRGCSGIDGINDSDAPTCLAETTISVEESVPKIFVFDDLTNSGTIKLVTEVPETPEDEVPKENFITRTPVWSRRRPVSSHTNERSDAMNTISSSYKNVNKKKEDVENLKLMILKEELEAKQKLNQLQLQAAEKDIIIKDLEIEIKQAVLDQVRGGGLALQHLFGTQDKDLKK